MEDVVPVLEPTALEDTPADDDGVLSEDAPADEDDTSSEDAPTAEEDGPADVGAFDDGDDDDVPTTEDDGAAEDAGVLDGPVNDDATAADDAREAPAEDALERELVTPPEEADCEVAELELVFPDELEELSVVEVPVHPAATRVITRCRRFMVLQAAEACPPTWWKSALKTFEDQ